MTAVMLYLGATAHALVPREVGILGDWLGGDHTPVAQGLAQRLREAASDDASVGVLRLGMDDIAALRAVLCGTELGEAAGLEALQASLCAAVPQS